MFTSAEAQADGTETCTLCMQRGHMQPCKADGNLGREIDLLVSGSPCDPFSTQRNKRFHETSVSDHMDFSVTMGDSVPGLLQRKSCIFIWSFPQ